MCPGFHLILLVYRYTRPTDTQEGVHLILFVYRFYIGSSVSVLEPSHIVLVHLDGWKSLLTHLLTHLDV